jgi:hypothetical protein
MKIEMPKDWNKKLSETNEDEVGVGVPPKTVAEKRYIDIDKMFPKYNQGRDLKFRVWYPNEKKFYYTKVEDTHWQLGKNAWDEPYVIQQYTGLKDKNNKEIYEGDIVTYHVYNLAEIRYETDRGGYIIEWQWSKNQHSHDLNCDSAMVCKIIGNIFENPELLK